MLPRLLLTPALIAGALAACEPRADQAPQPDGPPRVVSLTPALTEVVVALGRADWLAGVTRHGAVEGVPVVGDMRPDRERVLAQRPDRIALFNFAYVPWLVKHQRRIAVEAMPPPATNVDHERAQ